VIKYTKIILSDKLFCSILVTVANAKAIDRLRLNAQRLLIPTATWRTPYFSYFSMITRFLSFAVVIGNIF